MYMLCRIMLEKNHKIKAVLTRFRQTWTILLKCITHHLIIIGY